ncbi:MAG TPA: hypothetical protein PK228_12935 [Saprospiraceae bacterium]|nr:hypothetical protein [Saprospiraceae bacterium]
MTKQNVLDTVKNLPDEFSLDELVECLIVLDAIEKGLQQLKDGKAVTSEEARKRFEKWLS